MTFFGLFLVLAALALIGLMGWLGRKKRWLVASLLTLPFPAYLAYIEATVSGLPIYEDPYGPMVLGIFLAPIAVGWVAFLVGRMSSSSRLKKLFQK